MPTLPPSFRESVDVYAKIMELVNEDTLLQGNRPVFADCDSRFHRSGNLHPGRNGAARRIDGDRIDVPVVMLQQKRNRRLPERIGRCRMEEIPAAELIGWMRDGGVP